MILSRRSLNRVSPRPRHDDDGRARTPWGKVNPQRRAGASHHQRRRGDRAEWTECLGFRLVVRNQTGGIVDHWSIPIAQDPGDLVKCGNEHCETEINFSDG